MLKHFNMMSLYAKKLPLSSREAQGQHQLQGQKTSKAPSVMPRSEANKLRQLSSSLGKSRGNDVIAGYCQRAQLGSATVSASMQACPIKFGSTAFFAECL